MDHSSHEHKEKQDVYTNVGLVLLAVLAAIFVVHLIG